MEGIKKLPAWIDSLGKAVVVIAAASLGISIIYDWGFFHALGLSFSELPTSLTDHVRSSLVWIPLTGLTVFSISVYELFIRRLELGMTEEEIIESSADPKRTRKMRSRPQQLITIVVFIFLILYILFGEKYIGTLSLVLIVAWLRFSSWASRHPRIRKRRPPTLSWIIRWIPAFVIWMAFYGYNSAMGLIREEQPRHIVYLKEAPQKVLNTIVLRSLERGVLVKIPGNKNITFLPWPYIQKIQSKYEKEPFRGIICNWFNLCSSELDGKIKSESARLKKK